MHNKEKFSLSGFFSPLTETLGNANSSSGMFLFLTKSMNREKFKFRESAGWHWKCNMFFQMPKLVWKLSPSTSLQYKDSLCLLRKADMFPPCSWWLWHPHSTSLPHPWIHGLRSRNRSIKWGIDVRPQRTGHILWIPDRHKPGRTCNFFPSVLAPIEWIPGHLLVPF